MQDCGKDFCPEHKDNTEAINKHSGMWRVLLGFGTILIIFCSFQYTSQRAIERSASQMDKTFTSYMAANNQLHDEFARRIGKNETVISDLDYRVRALEIVGD